ncbi:RNA-guided pseudouridylation complex pseudouridine synthase subunit Cbf5 [Candidatus Woesearchaeota archaeon]|nr:RNA-guided pseudouridylation complex pseudouridine synthase subunit Cbf5 [Candidatus Woesearchaeota archaeon]
MGDTGETRGSAATDRFCLPFERIRREVLVRRRAETAEKYGCMPDKRPIDEYLQYGVVNIDKPKGPTSHQVSFYVQQVLGLDKSGHSGTLDPKVTGCLPIALAKATRIVQVMLSAGKEYVCLMHVHQPVEEGQLRAAIMTFVGRIRQLPPIKSSVKRQLRYRKVYYIEILEIDGQDVLMRIGCQAGTYIRKICHDIGQALGVGAHMAELRRTRAGPFSEADMHTLQELADAHHYFTQDGNERYLRTIVRPFEYAVRHLPKVWVLDTTIDSLCHGASLAVPGISMAESEIQKDETVAIMSLKGELVALGESKMTSKEMLQEKGIAVAAGKVFMPIGTYPKLQKD